MARNSKTVVTSIAVFVILINVFFVPSLFVGSLVAYWSFDEGSGQLSKDKSGQGNDASLIDGTQWTKDGKFGDAVLFDGVKNKVSVTDADSLDLGDKLTLEAWIYSNDVSGAYKGVISKEDWNNGKGYYLGQNNKVVYFGFNKGANEIQGGSIDTNNRWYHIAGTFDSSLVSNNLKIYVNGVLAKEGGTKVLPITHATTLDVGWIHDLGNYFSGIIDEVAIYTRALTVDEINKDMTNGIAAELEPAGKLTTVWGHVKSY